MRRDLERMIWAAAFVRELEARSALHQHDPVAAASAAGYAVEQYRRVRAENNRRNFGPESTNLLPTLTDRALAILGALEADE